MHSCTIPENLNESPHTTMPFFKKPIRNSSKFKPKRDELKHFGAFWQPTLVESRQHSLNAEFDSFYIGLRTIQSFDVTSNGYGGQPNKRWGRLTRVRAAKIPFIVKFIR